MPDLTDAAGDVAIAQAAGVFPPPLAPVLRRVIRVAGAVWKFAAAHSPKWLLPVLAVCLAIPGPFDEIAVLAVVLVPVLRSRIARGELAASVRAAWSLA